MKVLMIIIYMTSYGQEYVDTRDYISMSECRQGLKEFQRKDQDKVVARCLYKGSPYK